MLAGNTFGCRSNSGAVLCSGGTRPRPPDDVRHLEFASPVSGLGSKMGLDATHKWPGETNREWGKPLTMSLDVTARLEQLWRTLGLAANLAANHYSLGTGSY